MKIQEWDSIGLTDLFLYVLSSQGKVFSSMLELLLLIDDSLLFLVIETFLVFVCSS